MFPPTKSTSNMLTINSVLASPSTFPGFWIFMYRVSPFTYIVSGMMSVGLANTQVVCDSVEYLNFAPQNGTTCAEFLDPYIAQAGGSYIDGMARDTCEFCVISDTNAFLANVVSFYDQRWRNWGLIWPYIIFNIAGAVFLYWLARVPKKVKAAKAKKE